MTSSSDMHVPDMTGKTVVVTGANSGIGYETAAALGAAGAAGARDRPQRRQGAGGPGRLGDAPRRFGSAPVVVFDLADLASVRRGAEEILKLATAWTC